MIGISVNPELALAHYTQTKASLFYEIYKVVKAGGIPKHGDRLHIPIESDLLAFFQKLLTKDAFRNDELQNYINRPADELENLITEFKAVCASYADETTSTELIVKYVFLERAYKRFAKKQFIDRLELDTCVYCNRSYIYAIDDEGVVKPQIDHFYPQHLYPYLAMSYYNMIPACQTCNGFDCKSKKDPLDAATLLVNPYRIKPGDFELTYRIRSAHYARGLSGEGYSLKFSKSLGKHLEVFKLDGFYNQHTDHIAELVIKSSLKYPESYRDFLWQRFRKSGLTDEEIDRMIIGNYCKPDQLHKRPLAKLYTDIGLELGLIKAEL